MHTIFEVSIQPTAGYLVNCHLSNHVFWNFGCLHLPMLNNQFKQSYKLRLNGVIGYSLFGPAVIGYSLLRSPSRGHVPTVFIMYVCFCPVM